MQNLKIGKGTYYLIMIIIAIVVLFCCFLMLGDPILQFLPVLGLLPILIFQLLGLKHGKILSLITFAAIVLLFNPYFSLLAGTLVNKVDFYELFILFLVLYSLCSWFEFRKQQMAEDLFNEKLKAENSNNSRKEFTSSLSHQIRTPLNDLVVLNTLLSSQKLNRKQKDIVETLKSWMGEYTQVDDIQVIGVQPLV